MNNLGGHMLHGVDHVAVIGTDRDVIEMKTNGQAYMWANGAVTVYSHNPENPWVIIPAHRILGIAGVEHG